MILIENLNTYHDMDHKSTELSISEYVNKIINNPSNTIHFIDDGGDEIEVSITGTYNSKYRVQVDNLSNPNVKSDYDYMTKEEIIDYLSDKDELVLNC